MARTIAKRETALLALAFAVLVAVGVARDRAKAPAPSVDTYSTYDVASGGYRAAYELLERVGVRVDRFERRPAFLDASLATLVYADPLAIDPRQTPITPADLAALEAWVRRGGALVYVGDDDAAAARGVLHLPRVIGRRVRAPFVASDVRAYGVARIASSGTQRYDPHRRGARVLVGDAGGALVVATPLGRGRVIAVVDRDLFSNAGIATGDRARLLVALAALARAGFDARDGTFAFDESAHGYVTPEHWWLVVPRPFALAIVFGGLVLLVAFAGAAVRLGPPIMPPARDDRSSADFISALATLYERKAVATETLADIARATSTSLARALGLGAGASHDAVVRALPGATARAAFVELQALAARPHASTSDLVRGAALAHHLRKDHVTHGRSGN